MKPAFHPIKPSDDKTVMMENNENGVMVFDKEFGVMSLNTAAVELLGCNPRPGEGFPLEKIFSQQDLDQARKSVIEAIHNGTASSSCVGHVRRQNGKCVLCEYSILPLFVEPEKIIGVILNFKNLAQGTAKVELADSPEPLSFNPRLDYQNLYEELPEGVFTVDTQRLITSFNRTAESITGFDRKKVIGRHCWEVFRTDRCKNDCPLMKSFETGRILTDQEIKTINRKGEQRAVLVNVNVLRGDDGHIQGAVETFRPVAGSLETGVNAMVHSGFAGIVGQSQPMQRIFTRLPDIASSDVSVLLCGETGTGKDLLARAIHKLSGRRKAPFVAVNCSALSETLLESELFGHEKGAFTGAEKSKPGRFELAEGGTLMLDEIGDFKNELQVKLLRVLEQREFERVGGTRPIPLNARIISATNCELKKAISEGRFRDDLYYRLRTVAIELPPLRDRAEDIPLLVNHFIQQLNIKYGKRVRSVDPKVMDFLKEYHWPGNVRELERCIEHAFVFVKGPVIFSHYLPDLDDFENSPKIPQIGRQLSENPKDKNMILWALEQSGGRRRQAAELLGISRTSMWRRMKEYDLL